jgi:hypothetical protein
MTYPHPIGDPPSPDLDPPELEDDEDAEDLDDDEGEAE